MGKYCLRSIKKDCTRFLCQRTAQKHGRTIQHSLVDQHNHETVSANKFARMRPLMTGIEMKCYAHDHKYKSERKLCQRVKDCDTSPNSGHMWKWCGVNTSWLPMIRGASKDKKTIAGKFSDWEVTILMCLLARFSQISDCSWLLHK